MHRTHNKHWHWNWFNRIDELLVALGCQAHNTALCISVHQHQLGPTNTLGNCLQANVSRNLLAAILDFLLLE